MRESTLDHHSDASSTRYSPTAFDFLTGVFLLLLLSRIVPDPYIVIDIGFSLAASLLLRIKYRHSDDMKDSH